MSNDAPHEQQQHQNDTASPVDREAVEERRKKFEAEHDPSEPQARTGGEEDEVTVRPEDLTVTRDRDGQVNAQPVKAGSLGTIKVYPMAYGDVTSRFGDGQTMDIGPEAMAELFDDFVAEPDLNEFAREQGYSGLCADYVEDMKPLVPRDLIMAIMEVSGIDLDEMSMDPEETRARMSVSGN